MRLLICAGGTGGGVYPALSVLLTLKDERLDVLWVGSKGGMEAELVTRAGVPFTAIPAAGVHGVGLRTLPGNVWQLMRGTISARRILREFKPDVLFFTGGFVAAPMAAAGWNKPSLLYVPDIEPGLALRFLARFARTIALTTPDSRRFFKSKARVEVTGYPLRDELKHWNRVNGRAFLGLTGEKPILLVTGGSKGARTLNQPVFSALPELLKICQIVHICGRLDWEEAQSKAASLPIELQSAYHPFEYLHEMGAALAAADLVVSRAGASTLGEYPYFELPAILVPYQYAWRYQQVNAEYLARHGAAVILQAAELDEKLVSEVRNLFNSPERMQLMREAMSSLAVPDAANKIASLLVDLAGPHRQEERK